MREGELRSDYQICRCIRIDCWHTKGECDEPPVIRGGICRTCHDYVATPKCPTCGHREPTYRRADPVIVA